MHSFPTRVTLLAHLVLALLPGLILCAPRPAASSPRAVRVAVYDLPPLVSRDPSGSGAVDGLVADVLNDAAAREDWHLEYVFGTIGECSRRLAEGEVDVAVVTTTIPSTDTTLLLGHEPLMASWGRVFARRGTSVETILDLDGKRIAGVNGDLYLHEFRRRTESFGLLPEFVTVSEPTFAIRMLDRRQVDAVVLDRLYGAEYVRKYAIVQTPIIFSPTQVRFGARRGSGDDILAELDARLAALKADQGSVYHRFLDRWLLERRQERVYWWLRWVLGAAALLLLASIIWAVTLRTKVRSRTHQLSTQNAQLEREVAERARAEEALRESEQNYRELVQGSGSIILRLDKQGRILFLNDFGREFFEYSEEELVGRDIVGSIFPETTSQGEDGRAIARRIISRPDRHAVNQNENMRRDGSRVWVAWSNQGIYDSEGHLAGVLAIGNDVTDRKWAEDELERRLRYEGAISQASRELASSAPLKESLASAIGRLRQAVGVCRVYLAQSTEDSASSLRMELRSEACNASFGGASSLRHYERLLLPDHRSESVAGLVRHIEFVSTVDAMPELLQAPLREAGIASVAILPVLVGGSFWGVLGFEDTRESHEWSTQDVVLLRTASSIIGAAIERAESEELLRAQKELGAALSKASDLPGALRLCSEAALEVSHMDAAGVYLASDDGSFSMAHRKNMPDRIVKEASRLSAHHPVSLAIRSGDAMYGSERDGTALADLAWSSEDFGSVALVPVVYEGKPVAALLAASRRQHSIRPTVRGALETVASQIGGAIARLSAEDELRRLEERYRLVVDNAYETIVVIQDDILKFWNPSARVLSGYSDADMLTMRFHEFVHHDDRQDMIAAHRRRLAGDDVPKTATFRLLGRDGQTRWTEMNARRIEWDGAPAVLIFLTDIHERRKTEEALRRSEEQYRTLVESISDVIYTTDSRGVLTYVSPVVERLVGYPAKELIGRSFEEFIYEEDLPDLRREFAELLQGKLHPSEYRLRAADGNLIYVRSSSRPLRMRGQVVGVTGVIADVSERKRAEEALRQSEENLSITLNSIGDAVMATDVNGVVTRINPVAERLTGWSATEAIGQPLSEVFRIVNADTREPVPDPVARVMSTGQIVGLANHTVLVQRGGGEFQIADSGAPIREHRGGIVGVVLVFRDMTEQYMEEERRQQSQKMESVGRLAGGIAHDFNNLLGGILGYAELLREHAEDDETLEEYADTIYTTAARAAELTRKLLAFSRKSGKQDSRVSVDTVIEDTVQILARTVDRRIEIRADRAARRCFVLGDATQLQSAFLNLGVNARDAMPEGGTLTFATAEVSLDEEICRSHGDDVEPGDYLEISVADTGKGMDKETLSRAFEPFFTTKAPGQGTGLGLATVYGTARDHGGFINVFSEVGRGTVFKLYLPLIDEPCETSEDETDREVVQGSGTVLIVDDEPVIRSMAGAMLGGLGYETLVAEDGKQAIEIFVERHDEIDLVLLDMVMPHMNGRDAFREMRTIDPNVKAVISSGFSFGVEAEELLAEGVLGFYREALPHGRSLADDRIRDGRRGVGAALRQSRGQPVAESSGHRFSSRPDCVDSHV